MKPIPPPNHTNAGPLYIPGLSHQPGKISVDSTEVFDVEKRALIVAMIRDETFCSHALKVLSDSSYIPKESFFYPIVKLIKDVLEDEGELPTKIHFENELSEFYESCDIQLHGTHKAEAVKLVNDAFSCDDIQSKVRYSKLVLSQEYLNSLQNGIGYFLDACTNEEFIDHIIELHEKVIKNPFPEVPVCNVFESDPEEMLENQVRVPCGVQFMDVMLDGGAIPGELIGVLAPSGGGKTTIGIGIFLFSIMAKQSCLYISLEQRLKGDLFKRMCSLSLNESRKLFDKGWENVPEELKPKYELFRNKIKGLDSFCDATKSQCRSIEDLLAPAFEAKALGKKPDCIVIDWWGRAIDQFIANNPQLKTDSDIRRYRRNALHTLKQMAEDLECPIFVLHQLSGEANSKGHKARLTAAHAQEDKNFHNMFDFCFVIGNADANGIATVSTDKARSVAKSKTKVRLNGEYCRFELIASDELDDVIPAAALMDIPILNSLVNDLQ